MNSAPGTPSPNPRRSLAVPIVLALAIAAIVAGCMYYFTEVRSKPGSLANQARWRGFQQEHDTQLSAAQKAFEQHNAEMAAKKSAAAAHKSSAEPSRPPASTAAPK